MLAELSPAEREAEQRKPDTVHIDEIVPLNVRRAVPMADDDIERFIEHMRDCPFWRKPEADALGWDLRRRDPNGNDLDVFESLLSACRDPAYRDALETIEDDDEFQSTIAERYAAFARAPASSDVLLIDLIDLERHRGFELSPALTEHFARLDALAATRREQLRAESDKKWEAGIQQMIAEREASQRGEAAEKAKAMGMPMPANHVPMTNTQAIIADLGRPTIEAFVAAATGRPATDAPKLPDALAAHPLFEILNLAVAHLIGAAEHAPKAFRSATAFELLAVLSAVHGEVFKDTCSRIRATGAPVPEGKVTAAVRAFEARVAREARTNSGWITDAKGLPDSSNSDNAAVFLRMASVELRWNRWAKRIEISKVGAPFEPFQEQHFNELLITAANTDFNFRPREAMFKRAISALAHENSYDPVLDRIAAALGAWDGTPRLDTWLSTACHLPPDPYHRAVARNLIGGIVKRARRPGCKHDEVVILIGAQGIYKSTLCEVLALNSDWFTDSVDFSGSAQNTVPQLFGRLVVELAELDGMQRREIQFVKRFLSAHVDNVTLKYEAFTSDHARRCIFIGTSNEQDPLRDATGNRRFLPVRIEQPIDIDWVRVNLDQLIGEAAALEAAGEDFRIPDDVAADARARQEDARTEGDFELFLQDWFGHSQAPCYVLASDLATALKDSLGRSVQPNVYGSAMRRMGFIRGTPRLDGKTERVWYRGETTGSTRYVLVKSGDNRTALRASAGKPEIPQRGFNGNVLPFAGK